MGDVAFEPGGDLRDAVGAALVVARVMATSAPNAEGRLGDAHVVGGDDHAVERLRGLAAFPDALDERLAGDEVERFAGESAWNPSARG